MFNKQKAVLVGLGCVALLGLVGCGGGKSKVCKVAEQGESVMVNAWREAGLNKEADKRFEGWASRFEVIQNSSNVGAAQAMEVFNGYFANMLELQEDLIHGTTAKDAAMKAGQFTPEDGSDTVNAWLQGAPKDGKTPEQRAKEYGPRIAENERKIQAYQTGAAACKKALEQFQGLSR